MFGSLGFNLLYFFLYPAGHLGLAAVTFLVTLPLVQMIVDFEGDDEASVDNPWLDFEAIAEVPLFICNLITPDE